MRQQGDFSKLSHFCIHNQAVYCVKINQILCLVIIIRYTREKVKSTSLFRNLSILVGEDGFEPSKRNAADLQSVPFGHSGTPPYAVVSQRLGYYSTDFEFVKGEFDGIFGFCEMIHGCLLLSKSPQCVFSEGVNSKSPERIRIQDFWWGRTDSNHRSETQQIYSLSPLATRELPHIQLFGRLSELEPVDGLEPPTY